MQVNYGMNRLTGAPIVKAASSICIVVCLWLLASWLAGANTITGQRLVPGPAELVTGFSKLSNYWNGGYGYPALKDGGSPGVVVSLLALFEHSLATLYRLVTGVVIGVSCSLIAAVALSWSPILLRMFYFPAHSARIIPLVALSPLFNLWYGNSEYGSIVFVAFGIFAIVFISAVTAIANVPQYFSNYASCLGASRLRAYMLVIVPAALPGMKGGLLLSLAFGWSMVVASEFLGQKKGLGSVVNNAQYFGQIDVLFFAGVVVVLYALLTLKLANMSLNRLLSWAE